VNFDFVYMGHVAPLLLRASIVTFEATALGTVIAASVGLLIDLLRRTHSTLIRYAADAFVLFVRNTPLLIQIFFLFYILPLYGVRLPAFLAGSLALGLHYSTYMAEVYRAGIDAVPRSQWEAAYSLSMTPSLTWRRIILPQAIRPVIPPLGNYMVAMLKDTPLLSTIGVLELLGTALSEAGRTYRYYEPMTLVGAIFLALSLISSFFVARLEAVNDRKV
jgi:polar amino acid transport system permease protein